MKTQLNLLVTLPKNDNCVLLRRDIELTYVPPVGYGLIIEGLDLRIDAGFMTIGDDNQDFIIYCSHPLGFGSEGIDFYLEKGFKSLKKMREDELLRLLSLDDNNRILSSDELSQLTDEELADLVIDRLTQTLNTVSDWSQIAH